MTLICRLATRADAPTLREVCLDFQAGFWEEYRKPIGFASHVGVPAEHHVSFVCEEITGVGVESAPKVMGVIVTILAPGVLRIIGLAPVRAIWDTPRAQEVVLYLTLAAYRRMVGAGVKLAKGTIYGCGMDIVEAYGRVPGIKLTRSEAPIVVTPEKGDGYIYKAVAEASPTLEDEFLAALARF